MNFNFILKLNFLSIVLFYSVFDGSNGWLSKDQAIEKKINKEELDYLAFLSRPALSQQYEVTLDSMSSFINELVKYKYDLQERIYIV